MEKKSLDILILEEDEHWRQRFQQELERLGTNTTTADNAMSALDLARRKNYDLYLSGSIMFCYRVLEICPKAKVLFVPEQGFKTAGPIPRSISQVYKSEFNSVIYSYIQNLHERSQKA